MFCLIKVTIKQKQRNTCDTGMPYYWNKPRFVWIYWLQYTSSDTAGAPWLWETYRPKLGQRGRQQAAVSRVAPCLLISLSRRRRHHTSSFSFHFHTSHQLPTTWTNHPPSSLQHYFRYVWWLLPDLSVLDYFRLANEGQMFSGQMPASPFFDP